MNINGGCHCGHIKYAAQVDPKIVIICHCADCQTMSGGAFRVVIPCKEANYQQHSGKLKIYVKTAQSGNLREQAFCPECGTHIYATSVGGDARILGLRVGSIEQREQLIPTKQIWCQSSQKWLKDLADIPATDQT